MALIQVLPLHVAPAAHRRTISHGQSTRLARRGRMHLTALLSAIGLVGKTLARDLRIAGLLNMLGMTGETNVQGETVKKAGSDCQ